MPQRWTASSASPSKDREIQPSQAQTEWYQAKFYKVSSPCSNLLKGHSAPVALSSRRYMIATVGPSRVLIYA